MIRISTHQFLVLSAAVLLGTTFMVVATTAVGEAGRDGWIAVIPSFLLGIPFALMVLSFISKYPRKNFLEISEKVLGKWISRGFELVFSTISIYFGACLVSQYIDMINRTVLPLMPYPILVGGGIVLVLYLYYSGFEVLARFAEVVFPIIYLSLIVISILIIPRFEQGELFPILDNGIVPLLRAAYKLAPWPMEYILFLMIMLPFLPNKENDLKQIRKSLFIAFILVGLINTLVVVIQVMTFGPREATRMNYGLLVLANMVEVSRTISGVEAVFLLIWQGISLIKIVAFLFAGMAGLKAAFGLKSRKWGLVIGGFFAILPMYALRGSDSHVEIALLDQFVILPFTVLWVVLVWGGDRWKNRRKKS